MGWTISAISSRLHMGQVMTLTERNTQLQDLRTKLSWLRTEQLAVEESIRKVNRDYRDGVLFDGGSLYDQMFSDDGGVK